MFQLLLPSGRAGVEADRLGQHHLAAAAAAEQEPDVARRRLRERITQHRHPDPVEHRIRPAEVAIGDRVEPRALVGHVGELDIGIAVDGVRLAQGDARHPEILAVAVLELADRSERRPVHDPGGV